MKYFILFNLFIFSCFAKTETEAYRFLRISCEKQKITKACYRLGNLYRDKEVKAKSDYFFKKGCKLGHIDSCKKTKIKYTRRIKNKVQIAKRDISSSLDSLTQVQNIMSSIHQISKNYCEKGIQAACTAYKCQDLENKDPDCKKLLQDNMTKGLDYIQNPKKFEVLAKEYLSESELQEVQPYINQLLEIKKECSNIMKCDKSKTKNLTGSLFALSKYFIKIDLAKSTTGCENGEEASCYAKEVITHQQLLIEEQQKAFKQLDFNK